MQMFTPCFVGRVLFNSVKRCAVVIFHVRVRVELLL